MTDLPARLRHWSVLPGAFASSLIAARRQRRAFDEIETYCMFVGYPRSGHSIVGSLLDAHPDAVISHELDAFWYVKARFRRNQLFALILDKARQDAATGRTSGEYKYEVPDQWQGRFRRLRVIGDKLGAAPTAA